MQSRREVFPRLLEFATPVLQEEDPFAEQVQVLEVGSYPLANPSGSAWLDHFEAC